MNISRRQLKRIIREELQTSLQGFGRVSRPPPGRQGPLGLAVVAKAIAAFIIENNPLPEVAQEYWDNMDPTVKELITTMKTSVSKLPGAAKESAKVYVISIIEGL